LTAKVEGRGLVVELLPIGWRMKAEVTLFEPIDAQRGRSNIYRRGLGALADPQMETMYRECVG
jgi:hypothetical protein